MYSLGTTPDSFISRELYEEYKSKYPYPNKGDILISASGSIGRTVEFTGKDEYFMAKELKSDAAELSGVMQYAPEFGIG